MKLDSAVLYSNNIERAVEFYRDLIGLKVDYVEHDSFASFWFDNARLSIKKKSEARELPGAQTIFIATEKIKKDYGRMKKRNVKFLKELIERPWGLEFSIADPDGNKIEFVQRK